MRFAGPMRLFVILMAGLVIFFTSLWVRDSHDLVIMACLLAAVLLLGGYKLDYLHPAVAYAVPWVTILFFSTVPISEYSRTLDIGTCGFLLTTMFVWIMATIGAPVVSERSAAPSAPPALRKESHWFIGMAFLMLAAIAAANVAMAGYVPLISLITTGDSRYLDFGIPTVYGAFLAYSNALACLSLYVYLRTRRQIYLLLFLAVIGLHLLFVTRQNVITLLVQAFVIRCLVVRRVSRLSIALIVSGGLVAFGILGELRSGDIKEIVRVDQAYMWVPTALIWLYAYSYFSVLNLENMMMYSGAPFYDGFMWQRLLPSIFRPVDVDHGSFLELASMNVSSYIYPIYIDIGPIGVLLCTAILGLLTTWVYHRALRLRRFGDIAIYGCLFFCALMSFFIDFWFYLPVIFQVFFFWVFDRLLFERSSAGANPKRVARSALTSAG
jgi:oligosaccharide repeat unit polymerase